MIPGSANPLLLATAAPTGYNIERSLRFNSSDSAYLSRTPASAGNRKTWTWAGWVKRSKLGTTQYLLMVEAGFDDTTILYFDASDKLNVYIDPPTAGPTTATTTAVYRDCSAWYHIVVACDTTQSTNSNRVKVYVNGVEQILTGAYPNQNVDTYINSTTAHSVGIRLFNNTGALDAYLAECFLIDGQALDPTSFTEVSATTGQLIPKAYTGTFGTNGFWLKFSDNSAATATTLGKDYSGNSNNWTPNNLSVTAGAGNDSLVDTPVSSGADSPAGGVVTGNYCTLNPLAKGSAITLANGNLDWSESASDAKVLGTIGMSSGKWYWEVTCTATNQHMGLATQAANLNAAVGYDAFSWSYGSSSGQKVTNSSGSAYGATYTTGDVIGVAFDADNGTLTFYKNGTSQGQAFSGLTSGPYFAAVGNASTSGSINFGQRPFAYQTAGTNRPASTYLALCDQNLPAPVVAKPSSAFDVKLYTGNGSTQTVSGLGFSPDFVWIKSRTNPASYYFHHLRDTVRGNTKVLFSNDTSAEGTDSAFASFDSTGFTVNSDLSQSTIAYAAWCWDAGSSTVTNTQGSITSTVSVRANASAGFSVVTYTGTGVNCTVGHGLNVAPSLIIVKSRSVANDWAVYHAANTSDPKTDYLLLNSTAATADDNTYWNDTAPTSTVFSIGTNADVNTNGTTYVAYCWAPLVGYSNAFSFTGNGSSDGPMVWLGFKPRFLFIKRTDSTSYWHLYDTARNTYNVTNSNLWANGSDAEITNSAYDIDILSNGFKLRTSDAARNASGGSYVGFAWAENPFQYARAR